MRIVINKNFIAPDSRRRQPAVEAGLQAKETGIHVLSNKDTRLKRRGYRDGETIY
jgi:hypothetical protein